MITYGSTFSGIGGLDLAVESVFGAQPLWHVEPDPYAAAVLRRHWPTVPNLQRIELVDANTPRPTIICGGSPCQDLSLAGSGAGLDGEKSGLWWELARVLRVLDPDVFVWENVAAAVARALPAVLRTLAALGFDAEWATFRASAVGAPHLRDRLFLVAAQGRLSHADRLALRQERQRPGASGAAAGEPRCDGSQLANADREGREGREGRGSGGLLDGLGSSQRDDAHRCCEAPCWPPGRGDADGWARWPGARPAVRRGAHGLPRGVDARRRRARLRCLGNAVVPAQATAAISELWERLVTP